jgi:hypothetical protein
MAWRRYANSDSKREIYDRLLSSSSHFPVYLLGWYLDIICPDWEFFLDEERSLVLPIPVKRKWGLTYAIQPLWAQQLGVYGNTEVEEGLSLSVLKPKGLLFCFFRVKSGQFSADQAKLHRNVLLNLNRSYQAIRDGYHDQLKRHLKKADKAGIRVFKKGNAGDVFDLFQESKKGKVKMPFKAMARIFFQIECAAFERGMAEVWCAEDLNGNFLAAAFFLVGPGRIVLLLSGVSDGGKECGAMTKLIDRVICEYSGSDILFDFEGSDQDGLFRYYSGFGALEERYSSIFYSRLPKFLSHFLKGRLIGRI